MDKTTRPQPYKKPAIKGRRIARKTPSIRKEELVTIAFDLFSGRHFASVTIKDIARETGVNTALIYYYFENKEDLFGAVIEFAINRAFENFRKLHEQHLTPIEDLNAWINNNIDEFESIRKLVHISLDYARTQKRIPSIERSIRQFYDEEVRILSNCIRKGIAEKIFRPVDPDEFSRFISTYLDGLMVQSTILPETDLERSISQLRTVIWSMLGIDEATGEQSLPPRRVMLAE